jgi:methionyl aminopeptidase
MIFLRRPDEIEKIRESSLIVAECIDLVEDALGPGMTTAEIDRIVESHIRARGGTPSFLGYHGYPASVCVSINAEVVHGIPSRERRIEDGDIVGVDIGCYKDGYHGDGARTFAVGDVGEQALKLMDVAREALLLGIEAAEPGRRVGDISSAIQTFVESNGFSVVRDLVGHGVGAALHEEPQVPNYGPPNVGPTLREGMVLALEPMVNAGGFDVVTLNDGWTVVTQDGSPSAHFENTLVVNEDGPEVLTVRPRFESFQEEVERARAEARARTG